MDSYPNYQNNQYDKEHIGYIRLIPGVLGNPDSLVEESHSLPENVVEYPNYTKPASWRGIEVPEVLLSGNHALIKKWRMEQAQTRTRKLGEQTGE